MDLEAIVAMGPGGRPSLSARAGNQMIRGMKAVWRYGPEGDAGLLLIQRMTTLLSRATRVPRGVAVTRLPSGAEWVRAGRCDEGRPFLHLHGGGFFFGGPRLARPVTWRLSAATGRPVLAAAYRLAPQHTPADALDDVLAAYESLLADGCRPENIAVGGDSAGGHLTLGLLLALKEGGLPLPGAAVCLSPWVDMRCRGESHRTNARSDCMLPAERFAWLGRRYSDGRDETDTLFAPYRGDLTGLPPMMFVASTTEILRDDAREVVARARSAGVEVTHQEWEGLVHAFVTFADFMPEGKAVFRHIAEFLRSADRLAVGQPAVLE